MKTAKEIIKEAIKEAEEKKLPFPDSFARGALRAKYDMLRREYLELKTNFEKLQKK